MAAALRVERLSDGDWGDRYRLTADDYGTLEVAPQAGFQVLSHTVQPPAGRPHAPLQVIPPPPADASPGGGFKSGNPILFPFPNRVRDAQYAYHGRRYRLPANGNDGTHLHGLVNHRPWGVAAAGTDARGAFIRGTIEATESQPLDASGYPFPVRLSLTYRLDTPGLTVTAKVVNTGSTPLPMGFGLHPYFRLPLAPGGTKAGCSVQVPARAVWELDESLLPTGRRLPVDGPLDLRRGRILGDTAYDHVFGELTLGREPRLAEDGWSRCILEDPAAGARLVVAADRAFTAWVVYAPPDRRTICFEPYSCITDAINLQGQGVEAGLVELAPGQTWRGRVLIYVEEA